ncbi:HU family DNA-binding protein [candidate division KSB1 bacterium]|nr:HU family DNA-binding protein [candidate division KSB1 bacterium]
MNKAELIDKVAEVTKTKKEAKEVVESVLSAITDALKKGDTVSLIGFGTFKVNHKPARMGRNPQTGQTIQIAAKKVPKFVPGKALKDVVNK